MQSKIRYYLLLWLLMVKLRLIELILIGFIVALSIPTLLLISGDIQTKAKPFIAENEFSALFILQSDYGSLPLPLEYSRWLNVLTWSNLIWQRYLKTSDYNNSFQNCMEKDLKIFGKDIPAYNGIIKRKKFYYGF